MSEDEAINYLKEDIELYEDGCFISTDDDFKAIRIILNLIEKQQEEIEELKKDKKALVNNYNNVLGNFISKNKIKENIKKFEKLQEQTEPVLQDIRYTRADLIKYLKELIGEE